MKMRLAWYTAASAGSAALVVASAFHQRANFYSAMVHLAQSSLSLLVLANLVFVVYGSFMYGLQRLCFGPLRPVEIEQLYEKAWFAVTETCLAMTIFREEVGAFFLVMFTALVTGKVWGWIGEGRVEVFEQQPPANPRLFHARLSISLLLSIIYDTWLLSYAVNTVVQQARPTMMVMFLFEFAVLTVCSFQTGFRYIVSLVEQQIVKVQTRQRLEDRRRQVRAQREEILRRREAQSSEDTENTAEQQELPNEEDVDEMDIEVPGWESKGLWVLSLDLMADFVKLGLYTAFFCVLFTFYGLPIHIIRDWFMTTRSFLKRLSALVRYRQALKDMDQYPDATPEDLGQEDTCIICREEMRPWDPTDPTQVERTRAKKLPCGHILHFGCLKSWLERQQVCPTCRRPVARDGQRVPRNRGEAMVFRLGLNFPAAQNQQAQPPANGGQAPAADGANPAAPNNPENNQNNGVRMFNLGPLRLGFAQGGANDVQELVRRLGVPNNAAQQVAGAAPVPTPTTTQPATVHPSLTLDQIRAQLIEVGQRVQQEMTALNNTAHELQTLNYVVSELTRLRQMQQHRAASPAAPGSSAPQPPPGQFPLPNHQHPVMPPPPFPSMFPRPPSMYPSSPFPQQSSHTVTTITRHGAQGYGNSIPAGHPDLPEGVVIPPGWSLLPLQRLDAGAPPNESMAPNQQPFSSIVVPPGPSSDPGASGDSVTGGAAGENTSSAGQSSSAAQPAQEQPVTTSTATTTVTAPTPVAPTWGGSSQLFGGRATFNLPRDQSPGPGPSSTHDEGSAPPRPLSADNHGESSSSTNDDGRSENSNSTSKGKAKAAAVEDADDSEDDSS
ncbi:ERAD-associated E3 ubiquitin-protein ligase HRD1 [Rhypophila decipiens]|uniref:RING-type E3 ubiquitin transferase n=1 Tax=Rhypophila decipiens TaxID=261697 RepID=A0AAN7BAC1_9PEZI|nr:ERAD-associated E3 ubiquitin-protein ligase HRD1 [Rhypophila decipiens]